MKGSAPFAKLTKDFQLFLTDDLQSIDATSKFFMNVNWECKKDKFIIEGDRLMVGRKFQAEPYNDSTDFYWPDFEITYQSFWSWKSLWCLITMEPRPAWKTWKPGLYFRRKSSHLKMTIYQDELQHLHIYDYVSKDGA